MIWRIALIAFLACALLPLSRVHACKIAPPEPRLAGETDARYRDRIERLEQTRAAKRLKDRQTYGLQDASLIFIARNTFWTPPMTPYRPEVRDGKPVPPVPLAPMILEFPAPAHFKPVAWMRGPQTTKLFKIQIDNTSCGFMGIGDTTYSQPGDTLLFFAKRIPVSSDNVIDAIHIDKINDPALLNFVAKYQNKE